MLGHTATPLVRLLTLPLALVALMAFSAPAAAQISGELEGITKPHVPEPTARTAWAAGCSASSTDAAPPLAGLLLLAGLARRRRAHR